MREGRRGKSGVVQRGANGHVDRLGFEAKLEGGGGGGEGSG